VRTLTIPSGQARPFVLHATKGLVEVAEAELREIVPHVVPRQRTERFLVVELTPAEVERIGARARTLDDLRLLVAGPTTVRDADGLDALCTAAAAEIRASVPGADDPAPWSVTLSTRNPPWRRKPRWDPKPILARALHDADPDSTERQPIDVRLQFDGEDAHATVNIWDRPLGKQDRDITASWPGALRPTVAAALVRLAVDLGGHQAVYDPFCGSGTIVGEAALRGLPGYASDRSPDAVRLTRDRLIRGGLDPDEARHRVFVRDACAGPDPRVDARLLVTNPPWGKQVSVRDRGALFDALARLAAHTLRSGGAAVVLTTHEEQLMARLRRHGLTATARPIGLLGQTPAIVTSCAPF
jgi:predicted RNA methylase